jgi:hypothetical protein
VAGGRDLAACVRAASACLPYLGFERCLRGVHRAGLTLLFDALLTADGAELPARSPRGWPAWVNLAAGHVLRSNGPRTSGAEHRPDNLSNFNSLLQPFFLLEHPFRLKPSLCQVSIGRGGKGGVKLFGSPMGVVTAGGAEVG